LPVPKASSNREMIERVLEAEERTIANYVERMKQAEEFGDYGLANDLQDIISDETRHKEECEKLLRGVA
ncbi:MAG: ferritin-like domain-containing protein, partial [Thermomicrobium sp.]|nr:ferritin-like domain-containing protein [Thermomicrobium sp.]